MHVHITNNISLVANCVHNTKEEWVTILIKAKSVLIPGITIQIAEKLDTSEFSEPWHEQIVDVETRLEFWVPELKPLNKIKCIPYLITLAVQASIMKQAAFAEYV